MYNTVSGNNFMFGIIKTWIVIYPQLRKRREREKRGNVTLLPTAANDKRSILPAVTASLQNRPQRLPLPDIHPSLYSSLSHCTSRICSQKNIVKAVILKYVTYAISDIKLQNTVPVASFLGMLSDSPSWIPHPGRTHAVPQRPTERISWQRTEALPPTVMWAGF